MQQPARLLAAFCFVFALYSQDSAGSDRAVWDASLTPLGVVNRET